MMQGNNTYKEVEKSEHETLEHLRQRKENNFLITFV